MRNSRKKIKVFLFVLISILTISIGYASISAINMLINGNGTASVNQNNFKVHFTEAKEITGTTGVSGTTIIESNDTIASFNVTGFSKTGDYAEAEYTIKNDSAGIGAEISLNVTTTNTEFFKVTETINDNKLQAGEETTATVKVEMIKTPVNNAVTTSITATLIATPLENDSATGGSPASKASDDPVSFATDSWATIQTAVRNNNTSAYNLGDIKNITINNTNYTLRLVNKTTGEHCGDNDIAYSQTACGFVVEFVDIVELRAMNSTATNVGGWPGSELYTYLQGTFYNSLPNDLKSVIKPTRVISGYGKKDSSNFTTTDNLYLMSGVELFGADEYDTAASTTHQLEYYVGKSSDDRIKQYQGSNQAYWLRTAYPQTSDTCKHVFDDGSSRHSSPFLAKGVSPAFRIG